MFESLPNLLLGLLTGFVFGFLLQKGRVAKFEVITGQLLVRDWTVAKIMLTAIAVGSIGVYALMTMEMASLHIKPALLGGVIVGGLLFGCGMAILGYCPGATVAACGERAPRCAVRPRGHVGRRFHLRVALPCLECGCRVLGRRR